MARLTVYVRDNAGTLPILYTFSMSTPITPATALEAWNGFHGNLKESLKLRGITFTQFCTALDTAAQEPGAHVHWDWPLPAPNCGAFIESSTR